MYVDDFMIILQTNKKIGQRINVFGEAFKLKDLGNMTKSLGTNIDESSDGIQINQQDEIEAYVMK